jgi:hypothetical protein
MVARSGGGRPDRRGLWLAPTAPDAVPRRADRASGVPGGVRLSSTEDLGPCREADVVFLPIRGCSPWWQRKESPERFVDRLPDASAPLRDRDWPLPTALAPRSFGEAGGAGPTSPVEAGV